MIPAMIMILMRRYQKNHPEAYLLMKTRIFHVARIALLLGVILCLAILGISQEKNLNYTIKRNGNKVGSMTINEIIAGNRISLKMQSDIRTSFIFTFTAKGIEEATFENGLMIYSSVYQKLNGNEKINQQISYVNDHYVLTNDSDVDSIDNTRIHYNLVCLYSHEPKKSSVVYSDKYQKFLFIEEVESHHYKIKFPDGSANDYFYDKGTCVKVKIDHTLYSAVMELNQ
jgi:hypothetical protein